MGILLGLLGGLIGFAAVYWVFYVLWLVIKALFKKERFNFRDTLIRASTNPEDAVSPKKKLFICLAVPLYWAAVFYFAKEGLYEYIDRLLSHQMLDSDTLFSDIVFLYTIAFTFYQYAGFLAYDGVPDKERED